MEFTFSEPQYSGIHIRFNCCVSKRIQTGKFIEKSNFVRPASYTALGPYEILISQYCTENESNKLLRKQVTLDTSTTVT